jgi:hypothetical protein
VDRWEREKRLRFGNLIFEISKELPVWSMAMQMGDGKDHETIDHGT